jgi:hypothetical protein
MQRTMTVTMCATPRGHVCAVKPASLIAYGGRGSSAFAGTSRGVTAGSLVARLRVARRHEAKRAVVAVEAAVEATDRHEGRGRMAHRLVMMRHAKSVPPGNGLKVRPGLTPLGHHTRSLPMWLAP